MHAEAVDADGAAPDRAQTEMLRRADFFAGLADADVEALLPRLRIGHVDNEAIYQQGDPAGEGRMYLLVCGRVRLTRRAGHRPLTVAVLRPGDHFGLLAAFDPGPRAVSAHAIGPVTVAGVSRAEVLAWAHDRPVVMGPLLRIVTRRLRQLADIAADQLVLDVPGRVALVLLLLAQRFGRCEHGSMLVDHGLTQGQLADLAGAQRESVNKTLRRFADLGWISAHGTSTRLLQPRALWVAAGRPDWLPR